VTTPHDRYRRDFGKKGACGIEGVKYRGVQVFSSQRFSMSRAELCKGKRSSFV